MIETLQRLTIAFAVMLSVAGAVRDWSQEEPSVAADYYQQTPVCGTIEAEYTAMGDYEVSYAEYPALDVLIKQYKVWYPSALEEGSQEWPIVVMANGTGVPASRYEPIFQHLASWGFVVIGNEQQASWQGDGSEGALELLIRLNEDPESAFYQKLIWNVLAQRATHRAPSAPSTALPASPMAGATKHCIRPAPLPAATR